MFPRGKLGSGPPNPHLLSLRWFRIGETHQENVSFKSKRRGKIEKMKATADENSMISLSQFLVVISFKVSEFKLLISANSSNSMCWICKSKVQNGGIYRVRWLGSRSKKCVAFEF